LIVWALAQSHGDGHRSLVTPERIFSKYNKDLIFFYDLTNNHLRLLSVLTNWKYLKLINKYQKASYSNFFFIYQNIRFVKFYRQIFFNLLSARGRYKFVPAAI